jgi:hypothetical protein
MAAQQRANQTGQDQTYQTYSPNDFGRMGMTIDAYSTSLGGEMEGLNVDLFATFKFRETSETPWMIDAGFNLSAYAGPSTVETDPMTGNMMSVDHGQGGLGLLIGVLVPATRWVQVEIKWRPVWTSGDSWFTLESGGTLNVGNRLYVRGAYVYSQDGSSGAIFGVGGRL